MLDRKPPLAALALVLTSWSCGVGEDAVPERYAFLFEGGLAGEDVEDVRRGLPFTKIELEYFSTWIWGGDTFTLERDGDATWSGEEGRRRGRVSIFDYGRLCYLIEDLDFASLEPSYALDAFDLGTVTVRVWKDGHDEPLTVQDYGSVSPIELWAIQAAIEGVARRARWDELVAPRDDEAGPGD